jgi:hypothetical protein
MYCHGIFIYWVIKLKAKYYESSPNALFANLFDFVLCSK